MQFFILEYGKTVLSVLAACFFVSAVLLSFLTGWNRAGGISDSEKTNFSVNEEKRTPPVLYVKDFKVKSGENVDFKTFLSALDFDRRDLSSHIRIAERGEDGKAVSSYKNVLGKEMKKKWGTPGIYRYLARVQSPVTGKVTEKGFVVLVDYSRATKSGEDLPRGNEGNYEDGS